MNWKEANVWGFKHLFFSLDNETVLFSWLSLHCQFSVPLFIRQFLLVLVRLSLQYIKVIGLNIWGVAWIYFDKQYRIIYVSHILFWNNCDPFPALVLPSLFVSIWLVKGVPLYWLVSLILSSDICFQDGFIFCFSCSQSVVCSASPIMGRKSRNKNKGSREDYVLPPSSSKKGATPQSGVRKKFNG